MLLKSTYLTLLWVTTLVFAKYIPPGPKYRCPKEPLLIHPCQCVKETDNGVYVKCENTNIASISVGLNNLATFLLPIEELTINRCKMSTYGHCYIAS